MQKLLNSLRKLWRRIKTPIIGVLPGQIAFFLVLSIFPIMILVGVIASFFSLSMDTIITSIESTFPKDLVDVLVPLLSGKSFDTNIVVSMILGFVLASNGAHSIILASNALYEFPNADIIKRRVKAFFITVLLIFLFVFTLLILAFGDVIMKQVLSFVGSESVLNTLYGFFVILRWPIALFILFFNIKLIYTLAPDTKITTKYTTKGALFTTAGWILASAIYSFYFLYFANYDFYYGGLSSIVMLMVWVYVLSYILVIGIAINVNDYKKANEKE